MNDGLTERLGAVAQALRTASRVVLVCHDGPDGDTIGSCLGLGLVLARLGIFFQPLCRDAVPGLYRFLAGSDLFGQVPEGEFDCAVFVDCADRSRASVPISAPLTINIDHHRTNDGWGDIAVVDPDASSVGEMVIGICDQIGVDIDAEIATCLYVAIATDTGSFQFANTTARTLSLASRLTVAGADPAAIADQVFGTRPVRHIRLLGKALETMMLSDDGRLAWMMVTEGAMKDTGALDEDLDGLVNFARLAEGVRIGVLFREVTGGAIRVGFRGRRGIDVSKIAVRFGGGGHPGAAGCTIMAGLEDASERVLAACRAMLAQEDGE